MFRNLFRRGARAVQAGDDPAGLCRDSGAIIPTYCNDTVVHMPAALDDTEDSQKLRETGRQLADSYLSEPPLTASHDLISAK
jgi:hypothetical protein